jgi:hypothetical protein
MIKPSKERKKLDWLYKQIPASDIPCVEGCSECCGPVAATAEELKQAPKLADYRNLVAEHIHLSGCANCPYVVATGGGCAVYDNRPFLCRLYGTTELSGLVCPHGPRSTQVLTTEQTFKLLNKYMDLFKTAKQKEMLTDVTELWHDSGQI